MVEMKNESVVLFISEMNIDVEMNIRNELEMKHHNGNEPYITQK